ncbi:MAG: winged helix-turn-helix domain-containing protein [Candidatus Nanoarchaeia archaeon]|jgi:predicted transcriptional regulator
MANRGRFEIIRDILEIIKISNNYIQFTPLLRKSNASSSRFKKYYAWVLEKGLVMEVVDNRGNKYISLTEKGFKFLEKYETIVNFIEEFEL